MGPGYGEAVVVHLGQGEWLIVDSCVDAADSHRPVAPLRYLRGLGVRVEQSVKFIVVSHWDDDHVKGIGEVVEACPNARFVCSHVFPTDKFAGFVEAVSIGSAATDGGSVRNIRKVLQILHARGKSICRAGSGRKLCSNPVIQSWSPSDLDETEFLHYVAQMHPKAGEPLRKAILGTSNLTSVVLSIDWAETSVLLGADMERNHDEGRGWGAVVSEAQRLEWKKGDLVKVPHHGSQTANDDRMWEILLHPQPISVVAPFGRGPSKSRPPKSTDVRRISDKSRAMFLTARRAEPQTRTMDLGVRRSLREGMITLTSQKSSIGMVRLRRQPGSQWKHELFGAAIRVK
jgi:hypothetical protein